MSKICKKRVYGNEKMDLPCVFFECTRSLHFTLLMCEIDRLLQILWFCFFCEFDPTLLYETAKYEALWGWLYLSIFDGPGCNWIENIYSHISSILLTNHPKRFQNQQEMPFQQQKSAKKGSKRYLMFGLTHVLVWLWGGMRHAPLATKMYVGGS